MEVETIEDKLANIPYEGEQEETETPVDSPTTDKPVVEESQTPSQEGEEAEPKGEADNTPDEDYSKKTSKRVQTLLEERYQAQERASVLEQRLAALEAQKEQPNEVIPERWSRLFSTGDPEQDQEAYKEYQALRNEEKSAWIEEAHSQWEEKQTAESRETEAMAQSYDKAMDELEATGKTFDRNELMKAITERPIFKQDGQPDFETALELMDKQKPSNARKTLGTIGTPGGGGKDTYGPGDFVGFGGR